ncbi:MAG TPA: DUF1737 domain-containing protein [Longimicrobiaceae bacterium]|nr:DUF1737 domain-containing protein [Longimicrobiaceae bacterium]
MTVEPIKLQSTEINGANVLDVSAGTNGYKGGDAGDGSRTEFRLRDRGGTDIEIALDRDGRGVTIRLAGDSELNTFIQALEFAVLTLKKQSGDASEPEEIQPMSPNHGDYRLVVGSDPRDFARDVSKALSEGWSLYGQPMLGDATTVEGAAPAQVSPRCLFVQALTRASAALR